MSRPARAPARKKPTAPADRRYEALVLRAAELVAAARRRLRFGPQQDAGLDRAATRCHEVLAELAERPEGEGR